MVAIIWVSVLVLIYAGVAWLNKKTPKPKDCENITANCQGCNVVSCLHHVENHKEE